MLSHVPDGLLVAPPWNWNTRLSIAIGVPLLYVGVKVLPDTEKFRPLGLIVEPLKQMAGDELLPQVLPLAIDTLSARARELATTGLKNFYLFEVVEGLFRLVL